MNRIADLAILEPAGYGAARQDLAQSRLQHPALDDFDLRPQWECLIRDPSDDQIGAFAGHSRMIDDDDDLAGDCLYSVHCLDDSFDASIVIAVCFRL